MPSDIPSTDDSPRAGTANAPCNVAVWVVATPDEEWTRELLGDARDAADRLGTSLGVIAADANDETARRLIAGGADLVCLPEMETSGIEARFCAADDVLRQYAPRLIFAGGSGDDRVLAAQLAVQRRAELFSPALLVRVRGEVCEITAIHPEGRLARDVRLPPDKSAVVALRRGVGQPRTCDPDRRGVIQTVRVDSTPERITLDRTIPADPETADIQHLPRLVAGGRGVGGRQGFELLQRVARRLEAGVAASRVAVDLGWIERERQVGQTGKTVSPELYIACGISGASHHLEGMSASRHVVALNHDPGAPIFRVAHLGLVCDWRATLEALLKRLDRTPSRRENGPHDGT